MKRIKNQPSQRVPLSALKREDIHTGLICLLPSLILIGVFTLYPIAHSLFLSFHKWSILSPEKPFVGFDNYIKMFRTGEFWLTLKNTALYTLGVVPVGAAASLALALLLNRKLFCSGFFRTTYFLPVITSTIAISIVWLWLYDDNNGLFNIVLRRFGISGIPWLVSSKYALVSIMLMTIWKNAGYHMIILLAGLQSIPDTYYEAADMDGANAWQKFRYITWPHIIPAMLFVLITNTIFTFQAFGQIYTMTGGGPAKSTSVIVYYLYQRAFEAREMGYASAVSWVIFIILFILTALQLKIAKRNN
ncbi:MAG: sugar ABC transporter permease [Spirochaetales bacterium]|nr:sugar ABC transporter permease [Spirochaetales bacterium]